MMDFMRNGGINMWVMLIAAIATAVYAATRAPKDRPGALLAGCILSLTLGMLGLSTGMLAVSSRFGQFPDQVAALGVGLGELSNNGTFAGVLAILFGIATFVARRQVAASAA